MIQKQIAFSILVFVIFLLTATTSKAQNSSLRIQTTLHGFSGLFTTEDNRQIFFEFRLQSPKSFSSRIETLAGQLLAETVLNNDVVTVTLKDVNLPVYLDPTRRKQRPPLSMEDRQRLRDYQQSDQFVPVRQLITELILREQISRQQLKGFVAISMILGDRSGPPNSSQAKRVCPMPNATQALAFGGPTKEAKAVGAKNHQKATVDQCYGCCGFACWGCGGCFTGACAAHDQCVTNHQNHFHPECMSLLDDAIASMILECGLLPS